MTSHLVIPDAQIKPGVDISHIVAAGKLIMDKRPDHIIILGDWFDMHSLCIYNKRLEQEKLRLLDDIAAGVKALQELLRPMVRYNKRMSRGKRKQYKPKMTFIFGNHEERICRLPANTTYLEGAFGYHTFGVEDFGFKVVHFPDHIDIDGILYSHFFTRTNSPSPIPRAHLVRQQVNQSTTSGHQPGLDISFSPTSVNGRRIQNIIAGSFYSHDEEFKTPKSNSHWRGLIYKSNVDRGQYDAEFISIDGLLATYGGE